MNRKALRKIISVLLVQAFFLVAVGFAQAVDVKVYVFTGGVIKTQTQYLIKDTRIGTPFDVPLPFFLIKHGKDWVAFDCGNNKQVAIDGVKWWGEPITKAYMPVMDLKQEFKEQIKMFGLKPGDLKALMISHGHMDHAGAIDNFRGTNVPIYITKTEMDIVRKILADKTPNTPYILGEWEGLNELNIKEVNGVFDLFGDKTVILYPTPGHTMGHQSLYVKPTKGKAFLYTADALYTLENMVKDIPPGLAADIPQSLLNSTWYKMNEMAGIRIVPSHDPGYWKANKNWAPKQFTAFEYDSTK